MNIRTRLARLEAAAQARSGCPVCGPLIGVHAVGDGEPLPAQPERCERCGRNLRGLIKIIVGVTEAYILGAPVGSE